ncbi:DUF805 domain-containing protein [Metabacillus fastidiosus]|uniref:DUF805 domain-containing protein n=1 Tax=Metabacillus fastidiosus TaxID=1458 RepID=UPI002E1F4D62|nr:DUF805 domain-containing protein [Metabacillus fastidiosus]
MHWYLEVLKKYAVFQGRARRKEYWMFTLFNVLISIVLSIIEVVGDMPSILTGIYSLAILLPSLAVTARRLHDIGKSGWWILISLIPLIGAIVLLVFTCQDSEEGSNKYGSNPKYS